MIVVIPVVKKWLNSLKDYLETLVMILGGTIALTIAYTVLIVGASDREQWRQIVTAHGETGIIYGVVFMDTLTPFFIIIALILYLIAYVVFDSKRASLRSKYIPADQEECPLRYRETSEEENQ